MYKTFIFSLAFLFCGQVVPAAGAGALDVERKPLNNKEKAVMDQVRRAADGTGSDGYMRGGQLVFVHGAEGIPTIIAAPLQVVDVELESGEQVNEVVVGDSARWQVEKGTAGRSTHLFIKPIDVGLETSMVVTTDRRAYHMRLLSRTSDVTPYVGFVYQNDLKAQVADKAAKKQRQEQWQTTDQGVDLSKLNFAYDVDGASRWRPERVYDDGRKMYVQLPDTARTGEMPALMVMKGSQEVLVNYRVKSGNTMEVDGLFDHVALVVGVGRGQERVDIHRKGAGRNTGYFQAVNENIGGDR